MGVNNVGGGFVPYDPAEPEVPEGIITCDPNGVMTSGGLPSEPTGRGEASAYPRFGKDPGVVDPAPPRFPGVDGEPLPTPPEGGFPFPEADPIGIGAGYPPLIGQGGDGCDQPRIDFKGPRPEVDDWGRHPLVPTQTQPPVPPEPEWDPPVFPPPDPYPPVGTFPDPPLGEPPFVDTGTVVD
jgi:hypothetical protein